MVGQLIRAWQFARCFGAVPQPWPRDYREWLGACFSGSTFPVIDPTTVEDE